MSTVSDAAKFTAVYIQGKYNYSAKDFLQQNPPIRVLRLIPYSGESDLDLVSARKAALHLVGHIASLGFEEDAGVPFETSMASVARLIAEGEENASALSAAVKAGFVFEDEVLGGEAS